MIEGYMIVDVMGDLEVLDLGCAVTTSAIACLPHLPSHQQSCNHPHYWTFSTQRRKVRND
jgi:hypothetical protein